MFADNAIYMRTDPPARTNQVECSGYPSAVFGVVVLASVHTYMFPGPGRRRAALAAAGAGTVAVAAWPATPGEPSVRTVCRWLPAGLLGALQPSAPRVASLEVVQREARSRVPVQLCGTCHIEGASADAARRCVARCAASGPLHAVALECDAVTFGRIRAAANALQGLPEVRVRSEGEQLVRRALFDLPEVQAAARSAGVVLRDPKQVPLPPAIGRHLKEDGALWGREMHAAAAAGEAAGARLVFLESPPRPPGGGLGGGLLAQLACWLRTQALLPGLDPRSCAQEQVEAANRAAREVVPREYERHVAAPDALMAGKLREVCASVPAGSGGAVVAVVGAGHVPGLQRLLAEEEEPPPEDAG